MSEINMNKIVGEPFEELSILEMTIVQGSGDEERISTSPICLTTPNCAAAVTAITGAVTGGIVSFFKC